MYFVHEWPVYCEKDKKISCKKYCELTSESMKENNIIINKKYKFLA